MSYSFLMDGNIHKFSTAEFGGQAFVRTITISASPCGAPVAGCINSDIYAALTVYPGPNEFGYPALTPGQSYYVTVYGNSAYPPTPQNNTFIQGASSYIMNPS